MCLLLLLSLFLHRLYIKCSYTNVKAQMVSYEVHYVFAEPNSII